MLYHKQNTSTHTIKRPCRLIFNEQMADMNHPDHVYLICSDSSIKTRSCWTFFCMIKSICVLLHFTKTTWFYFECPAYFDSLSKTLQGRWCTGSLSEQRFAENSWLRLKTIRRLKVLTMKHNSLRASDTKTINREMPKESGDLIDDSSLWFHHQGPMRYHYFQEYDDPVKWVFI